MVKLCYRRFLLLVLLSCLLYFIFYLQSFQGPSHNYAVKQAAVHKAVLAQQVIGPRLIGPEYTEITTTLGSAGSKKLSLHPDFAAVAVELLDRAGVKAGDHVAVNVSGSFPALNIAVLAAIDAIKAVPVITSSVGASTWGATDPQFTWLDMEKVLNENGLWEWRSSAAAIGGVSDQGKGLLPEGVAEIRLAIARSGVMMIEADNLQQAIERRLELYRVNGILPAALINVGGSHVSFGQEGHKAPLRGGLNMGYSPFLSLNDGIGRAFIDANRPVIHFLNIALLAAEFGIYEASPAMSSPVFYERTLPIHMRILLLAGIIGILSQLWYGQRKGWWQGPCR